MNNTAIDFNEIEMDGDRRTKHEKRRKKVDRMEEIYRKMEIAKQYAIQRVCGFVLIVGSILAVVNGLTLDAYTGTKDATILLVTIPLGLYMILTRELLFSR